MRLKRERVAALSQTLVEHLVSHRSIRTEAPKAEIAAEVEQVITRELSAEDRLDDEVRRVMEQYQSQIEKGQMDERTLFLMIKKQLAKEKGIIL